MAQARGHDGGRHLPVGGGSDRQLRGEEGSKEKGEGEKREERGRLAGGGRETATKTKLVPFFSVFFLP